MSRLGRNPFQSKSKPASEPRIDAHVEVDATVEAKTKPEPAEPASALDWFTVELPSELFVLGLKSVLIAKDALNRSRSES